MSSESMDDKVIQSSFCSNYFPANEWRSNPRISKYNHNKAYLRACRPPSGASVQISRRTQRGLQPSG